MGSPSVCHHCRISVNRPGRALRAGRGRMVGSTHAQTASGRACAIIGHAQSATRGCLSPTRGALVRDVEIKTSLQDVDIKTSHQITGRRKKSKLCTPSAARETSLSIREKTSSSSDDADEVSGREEGMVVRFIGMIL